MIKKVLSVVFILSIAYNEIIPPERKINWAPGVPGGVPNYPNGVNVLDYGAVPNDGGNDYDAFINAIDSTDRHDRFFHFLDWLSWVSSRDPLLALDLCEALADKMSSLDPPYRILNSKPLIAALVSILREADETDDPAIIGRAIILQDRFLRMDMHGLEAIFEPKE